jgi:butyrate response factor 1
MSTALVSFYDFGDHCSYRSNSASTALQNSKSGFASTQVDRKTNIASVYNSVQQNNNNNNNNLTHNNNLINNSLNNNLNNNVNVMTRRVVTTTASVPIGLSHSSHRLHSNNTTTVPVMHPKSPIGVSNTQPSVALVRGLSTGSQTCSISNNNNNNTINGNNKEHKKLDRSYSEPAEKSQLVRLNSTTTVAGPMSSRYKTELCRSFGEVGTCKYGDKCQFAHGGHELRVITRHPKFKTENCKSFHSTGFCPYGPRCHFIHNSEESKTNILNNLQGSNGNSSNGSNGSQPRMADQIMNANHNMNGKNSMTSNGFGATYHSNNNSHPLRPKALSIGSYSLGSSGEISPPSSQSGSPTSLNSFFTEDPFNPFASPSNHALGSCANNAFSFSPDFASLVSNNKNTGLSTFGGSQPTLCPAFPLTNINPDISDQSVVPTIFSNTFTTTSSTNTTLDHHMNEGSQGMTRTPPPQPTPVSYPVAPESPVDSIASDVDAFKLEQSSRSPIPACSSPLDVSKSLPRLPIFTRFANNGSNTNNDLE